MEGESSGVQQAQGQVGQGESQQQGVRYPTRGYQTRSRASNQTRHEGAGLPEDDIENGPILGAESGDGTIMPLDRKIYISALLLWAASGGR